MNHFGKRGRGRGRGHFRHFRGANRFNVFQPPNPGPPLFQPPNVTNFRQPPPPPPPRWQRLPQNFFQQPPPLPLPPPPRNTGFAFPPPVMGPFQLQKAPLLPSPAESVQPLPGSEEDRQRNIAEASARIKEELRLTEGGTVGAMVSPGGDASPSAGAANSMPPASSDDGCRRERARRRAARRTVDCEPGADVDELRRKILTQFTSMSRGKIHSLVNNPGSTRYDVALQHLVRDMRLHLSAELRTMCNRRDTEPATGCDMINHLNSIVPDLGVELMSLPDTVVATLSNMLEFDLDTLDAEQDVEQDAEQDRGPEQLRGPPIQPEEMFRRAEEMLVESGLDDSGIVTAESGEYEPHMFLHSPTFSKPPPSFPGFRQPFPDDASAAGLPDDSYVDSFCQPQSPPQPLPQPPPQPPSISSALEDFALACRRFNEQVAAPLHRNEPGPELELEPESRPGPEPELEPELELEPTLAPSAVSSKQLLPFSLKVRSLPTENVFSDSPVVGRASSEVEPPPGPPEQPEQSEPPEPPPGLQPELPGQAAGDPQPTDLLLASNLGKPLSNVNIERIICTIQQTLGLDRAEGGRVGPGPRHRHRSSSPGRRHHCKQRGKHRRGRQGSDDNLSATDERSRDSLSPAWFKTSAESLDRLHFRNQSPPPAVSLEERIRIFKETHHGFRQKENLGEPSPAVSPETAAAPEEQATGSSEPAASSTRSSPAEGLGPSGAVDRAVFVKLERCNFNYLKSQFTSPACPAQSPEPRAPSLCEEPVPEPAASPTSPELAGAPGDQQDPVPVLHTRADHALVSDGPRTDMPEAVDKPERPIGELELHAPVAGLVQGNEAEQAPSGTSPGRQEPTDTTPHGAEEPEPTVPAVPLVPTVVPVGSDHPPTESIAGPATDPVKDREQCTADSESGSCAAGSETRAQPSTGAEAVRSAERPEQKKSPPEDRRSVESSKSTHSSRGSTHTHRHRHSSKPRRSNKATSTDSLVRQCSRETNTEPGLLDGAATGPAGLARLYEIDRKIEGLMREKWALYARLLEGGAPPAGPHTSNGALAAGQKHARPNKDRHRLHSPEPAPKSARKKALASQVPPKAGSRRSAPRNDSPKPAAPTTVQKGAARLAGQTQPEPTAAAGDAPTTKSTKNKRAHREAAPERPLEGELSDDDLPLRQVSQRGALPPEPLQESSLAKINKEIHDVALTIRNLRKGQSVLTLSEVNGMGVEGSRGEPARAARKRRLSSSLSESGQPEPEDEHGAKRRRAEPDRRGRKARARTKLPDLSTSDESEPTLPGRSDFDYSTVSDHEFSLRGDKDLRCRNDSDRDKRRLGKKGCRRSSMLNGDNSDSEVSAGSPLVRLRGFVTQGDVLSSTERAASTETVKAAVIQELKENLSQIMQGKASAAAAGAAEPPRSVVRSCFIRLERLNIDDFECVKVNQAFVESEEFEEAARAPCDEATITSTSDEARPPAAPATALDTGGIFCTAHHKSILDIKVLRDEFVAASEDGRIYKYCVHTGALLGTLQGHDMAVTCICTVAGEPDGADGADGADGELLYSGSLDCRLQCHGLRSLRLLRSVPVDKPVQCLDAAWGFIFLGTHDGLLFTYDTRRARLNGASLAVANTTVLMIKATTEGCRQVLIIASRKREIIVRDAFSGLLLRTMCDEQRPTIYSLLLERSLVYCGTSDQGILVLDFYNAAQVHQYKAGKGVVCMLMHGVLLYAGCYDGMIYVFNTRTQRHVSTLAGPGEGMLLSLAIHNDVIIAGTKKDHLLKMWRIPREVLDQNL